MHDNASRFQARSEWQLVNGSAAVALEQVKMIDRGCPDLDEHIFWPRDRVLCISDLQHFGTAMLCKLYYFHSLTLSLITLVKLQRMFALLYAYQVAKAKYGSVAILPD